MSDDARRFLMRVLEHVSVRHDPGLYIDFREGQARIAEKGW